jgi:hypothetical protein
VFKSIYIFMAALLWTALSASAPAFAGCDNFLDGSLGDTPAPKYRVCYDDVCDLTEIIYQCSNVSDYKAGYAIGWQVSCRIDETDLELCDITWQGRPIDPAKHHRIRFEPIAGE